MGSRRKNGMLVLVLALSGLLIDRAVQSDNPLAHDGSSSTEAKKGASPFAYVINEGPFQTMSLLRSNGIGALTFLNPLSLTFPAPPEAIATDPASQNLYALTVNDILSQFRIRPDGALAPLSPPTVTQSGFFALTISPDGHTVYACGAEAIFQHRRAPDGTLHPLSPPVVKTSLHGPLGLAITPSGRFAYALLLGHGVVVGYAAGIDEFRILPDGTLKPILNDGMGVGVTMPKQIVAGPDSRFVYVASEWINGGDYTGTGLLLFQVGKGGGLTPIGKAGKGLNSIGEFYLSTVSRLRFLPSGHYAVAISQDRDSGNEILLPLRVAPDGHLVQTGIFVIQEDGRLTGINMPHLPRCADISDITIDPVAHLLYLVDNFEDKDAQVFAYHYDESGSDLRLSGPQATHVGGLPYRMVIARPRPAAASRQPFSQRARVHRPGRYP